MAAYPQSTTMASLPQPAEKQLLHLCLRGLWDPSGLEEATALAGREPIDWKAVERDVGEENLAPVLYQVVRDRGIVPAAIERALAKAYYRLAGHNSLLLHELEQIVGTLADAAVPVLLLKGAALVETAYGNAALRPMLDLDLLVPAAQVGAAESALTGLGYRMMAPDPWPGFTWRHRYALEYSRSPARGPSFYVGLHIQLLDLPLYECIPISDWFARAQPADSAGSWARIPAPEDHLVYLCAHRVLQHAHEPGLLRFLDMMLLIRWAGSALDWAKVADRAVAWRLVIPLQRVLAGLEEIWPGSVPASVAAEVARLKADGCEQRVHAWLAQHGRTPASDTLLALATMRGLSRRARYLLEIAFPSPAYMRQRYGPQASGSMALSYVRRFGLAFAYLFDHERQPQD